jgi:phage-related protein
MPLMFPYTPDDSYSVSNKPRVRRLQFGDGEEQRAPTGLNHDLATWNLSFVEKTTAVATLIFDFLKARKGVEPFYFRPADLPISDPPRLVVCEEYGKQFVHSNTVVTVTATFREVVR